MNNDQATRVVAASPRFEQSVGFLLASLGRAATRSWLAALTDLGLTPHMHAILLVLHERGPLPLSQLAAAIDVDVRNMGPVLDAMPGMVERGVDPADRRRRTVMLSEQGQATARLTASTTAAAEEILLRRLGAAEREELRRLLLKLAS